MTKMRFFVLCFVMMLSTYGFAEDTDLNEIFEKVVSTYKSMQTYKAQGTIISDIDTGEMKMNTTTEFLIVLKKPNMYLIAWTQNNMPMSGVVQSGSVWNDGTQPYLYMGAMNAYSKMNNDAVALGSATGISGGAAFTIPSLFLPVFKEQPAPFSRLVDPILEKSEQIEAEDCYVISGRSTISQKETFWISKKNSMIRKYSRSFEPPEGGTKMPKMTDQQLEEAIRGMGQDVTEERKEAMRNMMKQAEDIMKTAKLKGTSTEFHTKIDTPELGEGDFKFELPVGTVFKESLFGEVLNTK